MCIRDSSISRALPVQALSKYHCVKRCILHLYVCKINFSLMGQRLIIQNTVRYSDNSTLESGWRKSKESILRNKTKQTYTAEIWLVSGMKQAQELSRQWYVHLRQCRWSTQRMFLCTSLTDSASSHDLHCQIPENVVSVRSSTYTQRS